MKNKEENFHGEEGRQFYLGNKNLPRSGAEFEWTPEMVATLKKCKRNILHFAENYFYIVNLDRGKEKIALDQMKFKQKEELQTEKIDSIEDIAELRARVALEKMNRDKKRER